MERKKSVISGKPTTPEDNPKIQRTRTRLESFRTRVHFSLVVMHRQFVTINPALAIRNTSKIESEKVENRRGT